jgi:hypothetical protein
MGVAVCSGAATAQRPGAPALELPLQGPGFGVAAHYARGTTLPPLGLTRSVGALLELRRDAFTFAAGGALLDTQAAGSGWSADAAVAAELCAPLRPADVTGGFHVCNLVPEKFGLRVRGGVGHANVDVDDTDGAITEATAGVTTNFRAPTPFASLEVWTGPRLLWRSADAVASAGTERTTRIGAGLTLGTAVTSTGGFGGSVVIESMWIERPPANGTRARLTFGAGVHYLH